MMKQLEGTFGVEPESSARMEKESCEHTKWIAVCTR